MTNSAPVLMREFNLCKAHGGGNNERALFQRSVISKLSRLELEDKFYRAIENNVMLKKQKNFQEEKLKLLGTKLLRLNEQLKREINQNLSFQPYEKIFKDQEIRIYELEKTNKQLVQRINDMKRQSTVQQYNLSLFTKHNRRTNNSRRVTRINTLDKKIEAKIDNNSEKPSIQVEGYEKKPQEVNISIFPQQIEEKIQASNQDDYESDFEKGKTVVETLRECDADEESASDNQSSANELSVVPHDVPKMEGNDNSTNRRVGIQTELTQSYFDDISRKLLEKETIILDLRNQLKLTSVKQNVIGEVENLFHIINQKSAMTSNKKRKKIYIEKQSVDFNKLVDELQMEKINSQTQKAINCQLVQKISQMQKQIDSFNITRTSTDVSLHQQHKSESEESNHVESTNEDLKEKVAEVKSFKEGSIDINNVSNTDVKATAKVLDDNMSATTNSSRNNSEGEVTMSKEINDVNKKSKIEQIGLERTGEIYVSPARELGEIVSNDAETIANSKADDATYDIISNRSHEDEENDDTQRSSATESSSCGHSLSDGEIPREASRNNSEDNNNKLLLDPNKYESSFNSNHRGSQSKTVPKTNDSIPVEERAEMTLRAISEQLETCKLLIATPHNIPTHAHTH